MAVQAEVFPSPEAVTQMSRLLNGARITLEIAVVARYNIADFLQDGPKSINELARLSQCDTHNLYRVLRALASEGIFSEAEDGQFELTDLGRTLLSNTPGSRRNLAMLSGDPHTIRQMFSLTRAVKGGFKPRARLWKSRKEDPETNRLVNETMASLAEEQAAAVQRVYSLADVRKLADI